MSKAVWEKLGIKKGMRSILINATDDALQVIEQACIDISKKLTGEFDYIHLFVITKPEMKKFFPKMKEHLIAGGMLWVSWPKAGKNNSDLNIKSVIEIGYDFGLVESKAISLNETWSALKFTYPKAGKEYNNSYGKLAP